jgi:multiple sugar transport system substrate-binding protein
MSQSHRSSPTSVPVGLPQPLTAAAPESAASHPQSRRGFLRSVTAVAAVGSGALAAACGAGGAASKTGGQAAIAAPSATVALEFLHYFTGQLWDNLFKDIVANFEAKYPTIKWTGIESKYNAIPEKIVTLAAGGTPPDGVSMATDWVQQFVAANLLKPLDSYTARAKALPLDDVYAARKGTAMVGGKLYGLPADMATAAMYFNKDYFDRAGVPYPKDDWTWADLVDKARRLTNRKDPDHMIYGFDFNSFDPHWFYGIFAGQGGEYFDKDLTHTLLDQGNSIKALQWFQDLRTKDNLAKVGEQAVFQDGEAAINYAWIGLIGILHTPASKVGTAWDTAPIPLPAQGGKRVHVVSGGGTMTVNQGAKQPDAAWLWADYMLSDEVQKRLGASGAWFPARKSLAKYGLPTDGNPKNYMASFPEALEKYGVAPWWYTSDYPTWKKTITDEWAKVWSGTESAGDAAHKIAPLLNEQLKQRAK